MTTPAGPTDTAGSIPRPGGVVAPEDELKLLARWVLDELQRFREESGDAYGFGVTDAELPGLTGIMLRPVRTPDFAVWPLDRPGDVVMARDPAELREFLAARPS